MLALAAVWLLIFTYFVLLDLNSIAGKHQDITAPPVSASATKVNLRIST
jgi:hypothetical protein